MQDFPCPAEMVWNYTFLKCWTICFCYKLNPLSSWLDLMWKSSVHNSVHNKVNLCLSASMMFCVYCRSGVLFCICIFWLRLPADEKMLSIHCGTVYGKRLSLKGSKNWFKLVHVRSGCLQWLCAVYCFSEFLGPGKFGAGSARVNQCPHKVGVVEVDPYAPTTPNVFNGGEGFPRSGPKPRGLKQLTPTYPIGTFVNASSSLPTQVSWPSQRSFSSSFHV